MLITYWGTDNPGTLISDYSNREWAGLLKDFYLPRWEWFINDHHNRLLNKPYPPMDFYQFAVNWCEKSKLYSDRTKGNLVKLAYESMMNKKLY